MTEKACPNLAWVIGYEDFTTFKPTSVDQQTKKFDKTEATPVTVTDTDSWVLNKTGNAQKWNLDTNANTGTIDFALASGTTDTPCMEGDVDNSVNYTCNGAGYMYCADWALSSNAEFSAGKGSVDNSSAPTCT